MKKLLTYFSLFVCLLLLVACGGNEQGNIKDNNELGDYTSDELKNLEAEVTFWHAMGQSNQAVIDEIIKVFNELYPNITVTQQNQGGYTELRDKIAKSIRIGEQPTIAQAYPDHISLYLQAVRELDSYVDHPQYGLTQNQINDYITTYYQEGKIYDTEGTLYSLPFNKSTEVLFINASWFQEHGLLEKYNLGQIVTSNAGNKVFQASENAHLSWEDIEEIGKYFIQTPEYTGLSAADKLDYYAFSYDSEANLFITITQQWGGEYTKLTGEGEGEFVFDNQESKAAIKWYFDSYKAGYFVTASKWDGADYTSDQFTSGKVKMSIGSSAGASYNDPGDKFVLGVLPYPQKESAYAGETEKYVIQQGTNVALFKCDDAKEELAGWLFLRHLTTWNQTEGFPVEKQPTYIWCTKTGYFPILQSLRNSKLYDDFLNGITYVDGNPVVEDRSLTATVSIVGYDQRDSFYTSPSFPGTSTCRDLVENLIEAVMYANVSIDDAYSAALNELGSY